MKTEQEYLADNTHCPNCDSNQIEGGSFEVDRHGVWQDITCNNCETTWTDHYKLSGVSINV